jgi:hypothetical protein
LAASLPSRAQTFERRHNAGEVGDPIRPVQQVEIEIISAETGEARLASARDARRDRMTTTEPALKPTATCGIAVMAKASAPSRTKTRLVSPLTFDEAAALVAYDPKVVTIWEGMRRYFHEEAHLPLEVVLFQSYEAQVYALLAGSDVERCGCLLLQRFGKVAGALAQLRQQPSIFNTSGDPLCPAHRRNQSKRSRCSAQPTSPDRTLYWSSGIRVT